MRVSLPSLFRELNHSAVLREVQELVYSGVPVCEIIAQLEKGIDNVMKHYEAGDFYIADLMVASEIFVEVTESISILTLDGNPPNGIFVIGSIHGDIHDIGKNIVAAVLKCGGVKVVDLGVDVPANKFIAAIREYEPQFVGISCLLTASINQIKGAITAIEEAGLRRNIRILVGGSPVDQSVGDYVKADAVCKSPIEALDYVKSCLFCPK